jgi:hypothetical protein
MRDFALTCTANFPLHAIGAMLFDIRNGFPSDKGQR